MNTIRVDGAVAYITLGDSGMYALVDAEDVERVRPYRWHLDGKRQTVDGEWRYTVTAHDVFSNTPAQGGKVVSLAQVIYDKPGGRIRHRNRNPLDNRKANLYAPKRRPEDIPDEDLAVAWRSRNHSRRGVTGVRGVSLSHSRPGGKSAYVFSIRLGEKIYSRHFPATEEGLQAATTHSAYIWSLCEAAAQRVAAQEQHLHLAARAAIEHAHEQDLKQRIAELRATQERLEQEIRELEQAR